MMFNVCVILMKAARDEIQQILSLRPHSRSPYSLIALTPLLLAQQPTDVVQQLSQEIDRGRGAVLSVIEWFVTNGVAFAVNVLVACVLCVVGMYLIRILVASAHNVIQKSGRLNTLIEAFICKVIEKTAWVILIMLVLQKLKFVDTTSLIAGLGVTGIIIGFACQDSLSNLAAGMMIALNQPFKTGDFIETGDIKGTVTALDMMATTLLTPDHKRITVPNKVIWGSAITNFSAMEQRRVELTVSVTYGTSIAKVKQVAQDVLRANPLILAEPAPLVEVLSLNDAIVTFVLRPWCKPPDYWTVHFATTAAIKEAFERNGIVVAFPERVIHLRSDTAPLPVRDGDRTSTV